MINIKEAAKKLFSTNSKNGLSKFGYYSHNDFTAIDYKSLMLYKKVIHPRRTRLTLTCSLGYLANEFSVGVLTERACAY